MSVGVQPLGCRANAQIGRYMILAFGPDALASGFLYYNGHSKPAGLDHNFVTQARIACSDVAFYCDSFVYEALKNDVKMNYGMSLSLWEGRALRPGEGPPRPLVRPTLPQAGG